MAFTFATLAAVVLLFSAASCAPAGTQDACEGVRKSSQELNRIAKNVAVQARNGSNDASDVTAALPWMVAKDLCDPGTLRDDPTTCVRKISEAIRSYKSVLNIVAGFPCCSTFAETVKKALHNMQTDMGRCVKLGGEINHQEESHTSKGGYDTFRQPVLCTYTMERLFSFSIVAARVFGFIGDPAHHTSVGSVQKCM